MKRAMAMSLAIVLFASASAAQNGPRVDSKAPCFRWPAVDMDGDGVFDRLDHCVNTPRGCSVDAYGCESDADGDGVCDGLDRCPDTPRDTRVNASGCPATTSTEATPPERREPPAAPPPAEPDRPMERQLLESGHIRLEKVYFETGSSRLLPESEAALREAGETLERYPQLEIEVQGHTDTRGKSGFNLHLSQERAASVREFLLRRFHLDASRLVARGYGESRPETKERNDEELFRNRRVVLRVRNPEALPRRVKIER